MNSKIIVKESKVHGKGVFALEDIKKGTKLLEYIGEKITKEEGLRRANKALENSKIDPTKGAVYLFDLNKKYDLDGDVPNNPAKYINNSCSPNCEFDVKNGRVWIFTKKNIKSGEEITINYCYSYKESLEHPCKCGSKDCIGYIVDPSEKKKLLKKIADLKASQGIF
ncbi:SET domain-containing protein [Candidatus Woesearchaeota archaeon]|nr:SET domain-containing protein [Candidatus Woesearchaeota archaeon]